MGLIKLYATVAIISSIVACDVIASGVIKTDASTNAKIIASDISVNCIFARIVED